MEISLLIGIALLGYVGTFIPKKLFYPTEELGTLFVPGTIAWLVVVVISFFIPFPAIMLLIASLIFGGSVQILMVKD